jgi:hypothetical protein
MEPLCDFEAEGYSARGLGKGEGFIKGRVDEPEDNDDRRLGVRDQSETFVDHKAGCEDRGKVEYLKYDL